MRIVDITTLTDGGHADELGVRRFAVAMSEKLARKRVEGRGGWNLPEDDGGCSVSYLRKLLAEHVAKGDMVDIANLAMMIWKGITYMTPTNVDLTKALIKACPECPDGYKWDKDGPTYEACPVCMGTAYVLVCPNCAGEIISHCYDAVTSTARDMVIDECLDCGWEGQPR